MQILALALSLFSLSSSPIWVRIADSSASVIGFWRLLGAALVVLLIGFGLRQRVWRFRNLRQAQLNGLAGFFFFLHLWTYVYSAQTTSIAHLVMIFSSAPIFTALGSWVFFRESFPKHLFAIYAIAGFGIFLLFNDPLSSRSKLAVATSLQGDLAALASAVFHTAYVLSGKRIRQDMPNLNFSFWLYFVSGLCFFVVACASYDNLVPEHLGFYAGVMGLIGFPSLLGHSLYTYLLKYININVLSCAKLAEPGFASIMAWWLFGEQIGPRTLLAFVLIAGAVLFLFLPQLRKRTNAR